MRLPLLCDLREGELRIVPHVLAIYGAAAIGERDQFTAFTIHDSDFAPKTGSKNSAFPGCRSLKITNPLQNRGSLLNRKARAASERRSTSIPPPAPILPLELGSSSYCRKRAIRRPLGSLRVPASAHRAPRRGSS